MKHLAELIEEEMRARKWVISDLVGNMGPFYSEEDWNTCQASWEFFLSVRQKIVLLDKAMALQLSSAFGIVPDFFTNYHEAWRNTQK